MAFSSAQKLHLVVPSKTPWTLAEVAGRLVEISGSTATAALTFTFVLVREAQECGEPVGWVTSTESCFYPLDAAQTGMDLRALVIIRLTNT
jgi:recombination protein RecA